MSPLEGLRERRGRDRRPPAPRAYKARAASAPAPPAALRPRSGPAAAALARLLTCGKDFALGASLRGAGLRRGRPDCQEGDTRG